MSEHQLDRMLREKPDSAGYTWWCDACRWAGHVHCADPGECGMDRLPRDQVRVKAAAVSAYWLVSEVQP